jgi:hypothetical protein
MRQINNTTYTAPELGDVKPVVTIGGKSNDKFIPNVNNSFHNDEFYFNLNYIDDIIADEPATKTDGVISQTINNEKHEYYIDDSGRLKWDKVFSSCPASMRVRFKVRKSAGVHFYYQPELTPEEIADGCIRPDDIIGSYAVYCDKANTTYKYKLLDDIDLTDAEMFVNSNPDKYKIEDGNTGKILYEKISDYKTGKLCHIPRPFVIDASGNREWCVMTYEEISDTEGMLYIDMPESFMWNADYSIGDVRLDPTFGYTTVGASNDYWGATQASRPYSTPASNGEITSISMYCKTPSGVYFKTAIYSESEGLPYSLLASNTDGVLPDTEFAWVSCPLSYSGIIAGTNYWLAQMGGMIIWTYDSVTDDMVGQSINPFLDPFDVTANYNQRKSIYATYTASGGNSYYYQQQQM